MEINDLKNTNSEKLHDLLQSIQKFTLFDHPIHNFELIETHISFILLTGRLVYKFKKPLYLGFLDFSTLEKRKYYCEEEVRLNRRIAPELYNDVVCFTGNERRPELGGKGAVIEYAVKMVQFPKYSELIYVLNDGCLTFRHIDDLAEQLAVFHYKSSAETSTQYPGSPLCIHQQAMENFQLLKSTRDNQHGIQEKVGIIEDWTLNALDKLNWEFRLRKHQGHVRECHGDLHLGNIVLFENRLLLFDCIEFSDNLRFIDVMSDIAFLFMDFEVKGRSSIAWRFLNTYLQSTGNYSGLSVFRFYLVYRAMVRAKVSCIRLTQNGETTERQDHERIELQNYIDQAISYLKPVNTKLLITHGLSGSGKTTISQKLLEILGAVRIRSDVERKRLNMFTSEERTDSSVGEGIYTKEKSLQTYQWLGHAAKQALIAGYTVIIDATFIKTSQRKQMQKIAEDNKVPLVILDFQADYSSLKSRIKERQKESGDMSDADINVLNWQIKNQESLCDDDIRRTITIDTETNVDIEEITRKINAFDGTVRKAAK
jgi:uncharacterized protein